jgi:hypothetical protein
MRRRVKAMQRHYLLSGQRSNGAASTSPQRLSWRPFALLNSRHQACSDRLIGHASTKHAERVYRRAVWKSGGGAFLHPFVAGFVGFLPEEHKGKKPWSGDAYFDV